LEWLELNSVESSRTLNELFKAISLVGRRIHLGNAEAIYSRIIPRLYSLSRYADKNFIGIAVEGGTSLIAVSSDGDVLDEILGAISSVSTINDVEILDQTEIRKLVEGKYQYPMLDFYLKLALRGWLQRSGYKLMKIGSRTFWSKGSDILYSLDADVDSKTLKGYISVDVRFLSSTTLWGMIISGHNTARELNELIDINVIVPYANRFGYGKIRGFIQQKVSEPLRLKDRELNLFEYWKKKGVQIDPNEEPVVAIEITSPEPRSSEPLYYPPSLVKMLLPRGKPEPHTRFDKINAVIEDLIRGFNVQGIRFRRTTIVHKGYMDTIKNIILKYRDKDLYTSPLFSMQKRGAKPLHEPITIPHLLILLPKTLASESEVVNTIGRFIRLIYEDYGFGTIENVSARYYEVYDDPDNQKLAFSKELNKILDSIKPTEALVIPVINYRYLFTLAKQICSNRYFHARVVQLETVNKIIKLIKDLEALNEDRIRNILEIVKKGEAEDKALDQLVSLLSNIVFSIYVEFILQSEIYEHRIPRTLTWALAQPADGNGSTIYLGYDVSRSISERGEVAVTFILYDSFGYMLNAMFRRIRGEKITRETFESLLLALLRPGVIGQTINRIVIYKDGGIRSKDEFNDIMQVFSSIGRKMGFEYIDIVGVIKRHNLRLFAKSSKNIMINPRRGTWIKLWDIMRHGVHAERALVVSSEASAGGTVKPVIIERYTAKSSSKSLDDIVAEYLRLCRLNYWNPLDGMNKYPLPLFMADKLAYLALRGVEIKTP